MFGHFKHLQVGLKYIAIHSSKVEASNKPWEGEFRRFKETSPSAYSSLERVNEVVRRKIKLSFGPEAKSWDRALYFGVECISQISYLALAIRNIGTFATNIL